MIDRMAVSDDVLLGEMAAINRYLPKGRLQEFLYAVNENQPKLFERYFRAALQNRERLANFSSLLIREAIRVLGDAVGVAGEGPEWEQFRPFSGVREITERDLQQMDGDRHGGSEERWARFTARPPMRGPAYYRRISIMQVMPDGIRLIPPMVERTAEDEYSIVWSN